MKEVQKNTQEKIRVEKRKYKGREFVDVRTYYLDDSGEWKPSPKGIRRFDICHFSERSRSNYWKISSKPWKVSEHGGLSTVQAYPRGRKE